MVGNVTNCDNRFSHHLPSLSKASKAWSFYSCWLLSRCLFILEASLDECSSLIRSLFGQSLMLMNARSPITFSVYFTNFSPFFVKGNNSSLAVSMLYYTLPCLIKLITFKHLSEKSSSLFWLEVSKCGSIILILLSACSISPVLIKFLISYLCFIKFSSTWGTSLD